MSAGVTVNGLDLGVAGRLLREPAEVVLASVGGWWDGLGAAGSSDAPTEARTGTVALSVGAPTPAGLSAALQALAALVPPRALLAVALDAAGDRVWRAERTSWRVTHAQGRQLRRRFATVEIGLGGDRARIESRAARVVWVASTDPAPTPLPIGTLPVAPVTVLTPGATGGCVNPACVLTDLAGRPVAGGSLVLTGTLAAGESVVIDHARRGIWTRLAGDAYAPAFAGGWRTAGDYGVLDPADGDPALGLGPSVAVTCDSGSVRAQLTYPLHWDV